MADSDPSSVVELTDPRALRALAHPTRLALVALLRREGPLTATRAADLLGESVPGCSFHLRQLARHGLVEPAAGGRGRERPWQATARYTRWPSTPQNPEVAAAADLLAMVVAERYFETMVRWIQRRQSEPGEWRETAAFGDSQLYLTAEELGKVADAMRSLLAPYTERTARPELRPEGGRHVTVLTVAVPAAPPSGTADGG